MVGAASDRMPVPANDRHARGSTLADTQIFEPAGRAIPFVDEGTNSGPAVVLCPGRGLNISYLGPLAPALIEEDFRIVPSGPRHPSSAAGAVFSMHDRA